MYLNQAKSLLENYIEVNSTFTHNNHKYYTNDLIGNFKIYHYFTEDTDVDSIIKNGLMSIDELIKNNIIQNDNPEYNKYKNRDNISDPNEYFKKIYDIYVKNLTKKEYTTYGLFFTTVDLFKFKNKMVGRIELKLSDYIKNNDIIYSLKNDSFLVKSHSDIDKIIKLNKQFENKDNLEQLYRDKSKTYLFENLPQVWIITKNIKVNKNNIKFR